MMMLLILCAVFSGGIVGALITRAYYMDERRILMRRVEEQCEEVMRMIPVQQAE
jgi:hypothetical protein